MSLFSPSDIVKGIELAVKLHNYGFTHENRAGESARDVCWCTKRTNTPIDVRYANFKREIDSFRGLLERLNLALQDAQNRFKDRPLSGVRAYEPLKDDFENERKTIVGDFFQTLKECDALLKKNRHFRERDSNVKENLVYHMGQQELRADVLRRRIQFHSQKIRLVIDRLSLSILTDLDDKVDDILANTEQNLQVSKEIQLELAQFRASWLGYVSGHGIPTTSVAQGDFAVSSAIAGKFEASVHCTEDGTEVSLPQAFDALLRHFEKSNEESSDQTPEGYLLFLKSRWLLQRIKEGEQYQRARPGFYYKRAINQVEQAILTRMAQPARLIAYDDEVLLDLPESCFHVWQVEEALEDVHYRKPDPIMVRGGEEKLVHIELQPNSTTETEAVTAIKSSEERIRIVHESSTNAPHGRVVVTQHELLVTEDRLIPRYAFPTLHEPCLELAIFCRNAEYFKFATLPDLHQLQAAIMGYQVSHDQPRVQCQFSDKTLDCKGRIQLWQEPIILPPPASPHETDPLSSLASQPSRTSSKKASLSSSFAPTSTVFATDDGWEADRIRSSRLVIFTQLAEAHSRSKRKPKRFAAIALDLERRIYVDSNSCACHRDPTCSIVVIRAKEHSPFAIQYVQSDTDSDGNPNPTTFNILPLRTPSNARSQSAVIKKQTKHLLLAFEDLGSKALFLRELDLRFAVRDKQIRDQHDFEANLRFHQEHPKRFQQCSGQFSTDGRAQSVSSQISVASPTIRPVVRNDTLSIASVRSRSDGIGNSSAVELPHGHGRVQSIVSVASSRPDSGVELGESRLMLERPEGNQHQGPYRTDTVKSSWMSSVKTKMRQS